MTRAQGGLGRLAGDTAVYGLADAVGKGLSLILFPIFTRIFTPREYGVMEVIGTVTLLISAVLVLGLDNATTRHYYGAENRSRGDVVLGSALAFSLTVYFGGTVPLLFASRWIAATVFGTDEYRRAMFVALFAVPFVLLVNFSLNTLRRVFRPWSFAGLSLAWLGLTISLNLLLVWRLRWGVEGTYYANLIAGTVMAGAGILCTRRHYRWAWDGRLIVSLLRYGIPLVPASLCLWGLSVMDRFFLVHYSTLTDVGLYSTANRLTSILAFGVGAFQMAWGPFAFAISDERHARTTYSRTLSYYMAAGGLAVLLLSLFAREALQVLTPPGYHRAAVAVAPLALAVLAYGAYTLVAIGVNLANRTSQVSITLAAAVVINLALNFLLIPRFGMVGAAYATAAGWAASAGFLFVASQRAYWIPYDGTLLSCMLALLLTCLGFGLIVGGDAEPSVSRVVLKGLAVIVFLVGLKMLGVVPTTVWVSLRPAREAP